MLKEFVVEYEVFEDIGETVLTVADREKDEALNMFRGKTAENIYKFLTGEDAGEMSLNASEGRDDDVTAKIKEYVEEIKCKLNVIMEDDTLSKEIIKKMFDEIRELVDCIEKLALEG